MIAYLPYAYQLKCVPPGKVAHHHYDVMGTAPFEVPSTGGADAPVSCELLDVPYRSFEGRSYRAAGTTLSDLQERLRDGDAANARKRSKVPWLGVLMEPLFEGRGAGAGSPFGRPTEAAKVEELVKDARRGRLVRDRSDDGEAARAAAAAAWRRNLLVVDGEPWVAAREPRYLLEHHGRAIVLKAGTGPSEGAGFSIGFRADRRDEVVAYGQALAASVRGRFFLDDAFLADVAVRSPERLTYDEAEGVAKAIYDETRNGFLSSDCGGLTDADIRRRRIEGDGSWAVELLELPVIRSIIGRGGSRGLAHEREAYVKACHANLDAWTGFFRERLLRPVQAQEEDYLLSVGGP